MTARPTVLPIGSMNGEQRFVCRSCGSGIGARPRLEIPVLALRGGHWVAFLGDDTVPSPGWLAIHLGALERASEQGLEPAILGYTRWHRRMRLNPFLRYINDYGLQFGYALIEDKEHLPFNFFYTSNLSLRRSLLIEEPFDEGFPYAAWEDTELSYRLDKQGLRLLYRPEAVVEHDHPTDIQRFGLRQYRAGYSAVLFYRRHPELGPWLGLGMDGPPALPAAVQQRVREALARILARTLHFNRFSRMKEAPGWLKRLWESVLRYHYIEGLRQGWDDRVGLAETSQENDAP